MGVIPKSEERGADSPLRLSSSSKASFVMEAVTSSVANVEARPLRTGGGGKDEEVVAINKDSTPLTISFQELVTRDLAASVKCEAGMAALLVEEAVVEVMEELAVEEMLDEAAETTDSFVLPMILLESVN